MGFLTALKRVWDIATVINTEHIMVHLSPGQTNDAYILRYSSGTEIKCVATLFVKLNDKNNVSKMKSADKK